MKKKLTSVIEWVETKKRKPDCIGNKLVFIDGDVRASFYSKIEGFFWDYPKYHQPTHWAELPKFPKTK